jgi:excisionase family DNA binding protein
LTQVLLLTIAEVAKVTMLSESKLRLMVKSGEIPVVRIGSAVRVPYGALVDWVNERVGLV